MTVQQQTQPAVTERTKQADFAAGATAQEKAQEKARETENAVEEMREFEKGVPPTDLKDWPSGPAKYLTYGNEDGEDNEVYGDGLTGKLGPANLRRFDDGSITIDGEQVDNPDDYKGQPLVGGPTDPNAPS